MNELGGVTLEIGTRGRQVILTLRLAGQRCMFDMEPDEARELVNGLGGAIKFATTAGELTYE